MLLQSDLKPRSEPIFSAAIIPCIEQQAKDCKNWQIRQVLYLPWTAVYGEGKSIAIIVRLSIRFVESKQNHAGTFHFLMMM